MKIFSKSHRKGKEDEEYEVRTFAPCEIPDTKELAHRQREDRIKKKYCGVREKN